MKKLKWDNLSSILLAITLALILWVYATYENDAPYTDIFSETITIQIQNQDVDMAVVDSVEETVQVTIRAFQSDWDTLTANSFRATADWGGLGEGVHTVPIIVTCSDPTVTIISVQPEAMYVELEPIIARTAQIDLRLTDEDSLALGYVLGTPAVSPTTVTISGPESVIEKVSSVRATLSLLDKSESIDQDVVLIALDANGEIVGGVTIYPEKTHVSIELEQTLTSREVAVRASTTGQPARGYFISGLSTDPATITVIGPPSIVEDMSGLISTVSEIDVTDATRMIAERLELDLPDEVTAIDENNEPLTEVLVTVEIDAITSGTTIEVPLTARDLSDGYEVELSVETVDVILTGPAVVIDELNTALVEAYVDLSGLEEGTHQLKTSVELLVAQNPNLADLVVTSISPAFVEVTIQSLATPTPTPTVKPSATPTRIATPAPTKNSTSP